MFCFWTYMVAFLIRVSSGKQLLTHFTRKPQPQDGTRKKIHGAIRVIRVHPLGSLNAETKLDPQSVLAVEIFLSWLNRQPDSSSNWRCPPPSHAANTAKNPSDVYGTVYTFMHDVMLHGKTRQEATVFTPLDELLYAAVVPLPHPSHPSCENEFICITANIMVLRGWERGSPNMQDGTIKKKPLTLMKMYTI